MPSVKRTFTLPDKVSESLDAKIPKSQRSKYIAELIESDLKKKSKAKALAFLADIEKYQIPAKKSSVEAVREMREAWIADLLADHDANEKI